MYKNAGLFGHTQINATEFTPKDVYELDFFDVTGKNVPNECMEHTYYGYCQLMGKVIIDLDISEQISPYDHMFETCPTTAPSFYRPKGC